MAIDLQGKVRIKGSDRPVTKFMSYSIPGPGQEVPTPRNVEDGAGFFNFYHGAPLPTKQRIVLIFEAPGYWPKGVEVDLFDQTIALDVELEPSAGNFPR